MVALPLLGIGGWALAQLNADVPGAIFGFAGPTHFSRQEEFAGSTVDIHPEVHGAARGDLAIRGELQASDRYVVRDTGDGDAYESRALRGGYDLCEQAIAALGPEVPTSVAHHTPKMCRFHPAAKPHGTEIDYVGHRWRSHDGSSLLRSCI
jgi:hypothetical protein